MKANKPKTEESASNTETRLPTYESMGQCAAATHIPLAVLKRAKRSGCDAFITGNRIRLEALLRWVFENDVEEQIDFQTERALELRAKRKRIEREEAEAARELVRLEEVERELSGRVLLPLRERLVGQPTRLDVRANPEHPEIARRALEQDRDETLELLNKANR